MTNVRIFNNTIYGKADDAIRVDDPGSAYRFERLHLRTTSRRVSSRRCEQHRAYISDRLPRFRLQFIRLAGEISDCRVRTWQRHLDWRAVTGGDSHSLGLPTRIQITSVRSPPCQRRCLRQGERRYRSPTSLQSTSNTSPPLRPAIGTSVPMNGMVASSGTHSNPEISPPGRITSPRDSEITPTCGASKALYNLCAPATDLFTEMRPSAIAISCGA